MVADGLPVSATLGFASQTHALQTQTWGIIILDCNKMSGS